MPPPIPTELLFPLMEENRDRLEKCLIMYYRDSTSNTCKHQLLPLMEGPPVCIKVAADTEPVAVHTPIAIPFHWQEKVKSDLDRDITS
jgi:hypothetical protein